MIERAHLASHTVALLVVIPTTTLEIPVLVRVLLHDHRLNTLGRVGEPKIHVAVIRILGGSTGARLVLFGLLFALGVFAFFSFRGTRQTSAGGTGRRSVTVTTAVWVSRTARSRSYSRRRRRTRSAALVATRWRFVAPGTSAFPFLAVQTSGMIAIARFLSGT